MMIDTRWFYDRSAILPPRPIQMELKHLLWTKLLHALVPGQQEVELAYVKSKMPDWIREMMESFWREVLKQWYWEFYEGICGCHSCRDFREQFKKVAT